MQQIVESDLRDVDQKPSIVFLIELNVKISH